MTVLEVKDLHVRYGAHAAVQGVDLHLEKGEVAVVLGANGAGKSSTLAAICGAVEPARGEIWFEGDPVTGLPPHQLARMGMALVPEGRRIVAPLSVEENLQLGAYTTRSQDRRTQLRGKVFDLFPEIAALRSRTAGLLSGGEQQMLALGRALMSDPRLLLLDEPSMGLAPIVVETVIDGIRAVADAGMTILMVEQNAAAAFRVGQTAYVLHQGEIVLAQPVTEAKDDPGVMRAFLGLDSNDGTNGSRDGEGDGH